jgi:aerobic C4-dicarboxylate transport protein
MSKLEKLGCSKSLVGLVPNGLHLQHRRHRPLYDHGRSLGGAGHKHAPNADPTTDHPGGCGSDFERGERRAGASFIALVATLSVIPTIPVEGMALILGIDRFLSMFRGLVNMIGNGLATLVPARWEGELERQTLRQTSPEKRHCLVLGLHPQFCHKRRCSKRGRRDFALNQRDSGI